jgi:hypothetical protein
MRLCGEHDATSNLEFESAIVASIFEHVPISATILAKS